MKKATDDFDVPRSEWERAIDEWIFSERDRALVRRRLLDGICYEPLSEEFGLSVQQTKTIIYKAQDRLFRKMK